MLEVGHLQGNPHGIARVGKRYGLRHPLRFRGFGGCTDGAIRGSQLIVDPKRVAGIDLWHFNCQVLDVVWKQKPQLIGAIALAAASFSAFIPGLGEFLEFAG